MIPRVLPAAAALVVGLAGCQLFLGGEDYVLDPGSGGAGGEGGATTSSSTGGGATTSTTSTTSTSSSGGGGAGGGTMTVEFGDAEVLATGRGALSKLAHADATLYYLVDGVALGDGRIEALSTTGGAPTTLLAGLTEPRGIAVDATHVYTSTGPLTAGDTLCHVVRVPRVGGASEDLLTATAPGGAGAVTSCYPEVAVGGGRVYASVVALAEFGGNAHLRSMPLPTGASGAVGLAAQDTTPIPSVSVQGAQVFWADPSSGRLLRAAGTNSINNLNGAAPGPGASSVTTGLTLASEVEVRLDVAYALSGLGVSRVSAQSSAVVSTILTDAVLAPRGLSVDATHVYWTDGTTREVRAIPVGGGASEVLWQPPTETPVDTVATGAAVFVITAEGSVARIDKTIP